MRFLCFFSESNEICVHRIPFDLNFWTDKLLPKLKQFYINYGLKFIADRATDEDNCPMLSEGSINADGH